MKKLLLIILTILILAPICDAGEYRKVIAKKNTPTGGGLTSWHDFGWKASYLADDNSGVGDGNDVETWADGQTGGADLTTPGNAPSYDADGCPNSTPAVAFLVNEYARNTSVTCADGNNRCMLVIIGGFSVAPANGDVIFSGEGAGARTELYNSGTYFKLYADGAAITTSLTVDTNIHAIVWDMDGTTGGSTPLYVDTNSDDQDAGTSAVDGGIVLGAGRYFTNYSDFNYCAVGLYEGDVTADSEWSDLQDYVCDKWGLDLITNSCP